MKKKLSLNKETLRDLAEGDLDRAAGGNGGLLTVGGCPPCTTRPITACCPPSISVPGCVCLNTTTGC